MVDVTNFARCAKNFNNQPCSMVTAAFIRCLQVVERWRLADANTINYEATITDPKVFTRPWTLRFTLAVTRTEVRVLRERLLRGAHARAHDRAGLAAKAKGLTGIHEHTKGFYGGK